MQLDERSCDEEEEYQPISQAKEFDESVETSRSGRDYITPGVSLLTRSIFSSPERTDNTDSASTATRWKEGSPPLNPFPRNLDAKSMAMAEIWLPTFNGNGAEDPKQHWFLYEVVCMV